MGVWGFGPFDGDTALDVLAEICGEAAPGVDVDTAIPDRAAQAVVTGLLSVYMHSSDPHIRYACAGLVAAKLAGVPSGAGTSLFSPDAHASTAVSLLTAICGYVNLVSREAAEELAGQARNVLTALAADSAWLCTYRDPEGALKAVSAVADTVAQH